MQQNGDCMKTQLLASFVLLSIKVHRPISQQLMKACGLVYIENTFKVRFTHLSETDFFARNLHLFCKHPFPHPSLSAKLFTSLTMKKQSCTYFMCLCKFTGFFLEHWARYWDILLPFIFNLHEHSLAHIVWSCSFSRVATVDYTRFCAGADRAETGVIAPR